MPREKAGRCGTAREGGQGWGVWVGKCSDRPVSQGEAGRSVLGRGLGQLQPLVEPQPSQT
ncbi:hypothetical protein GCM10009541_24700 [Micromonospora gifhornensis]|uniref:Uncharacterized protein n=1 Tax=Micromonospora gifhornensis TaxID=84594 RepID=A0ABQ4IIV5_9ACTN|nr:hypothetical protein Vgi01_45360 [Micromonospora gifhornensis]